MARESEKIELMARKLIQHYSKTYMKKPNVVGLGFGNKKRKNRYIKQPCIAFFVIKKLPEKEIPIEDILPKTLELEGFSIITDVVQTGRFHAIHTNRERQRPARPGVSIGRGEDTGTFGAVVIDRLTGNRVILSNNHVLANENEANIGDAILQPGSDDGGIAPDDVIGTLLRFHPIVFDYPEADNRADASLCLPTSPDLIRNLPNFTPTPSQNNKAIGLIFAKNRIKGWTITVLNRIRDVIDELDISFPEPNAVGEPRTGMTLIKTGRTTGLSSGTILYTSVDVQVYYSWPMPKMAAFVNQIISNITTRPGDSGSLAIQGTRADSREV